MTCRRKNNNNQDPQIRGHSFAVRPLVYKQYSQILKLFPRYIKLCTRINKPYPQISDPCPCFRNPFPVLQTVLEGFVARACSYILMKAKVRISQNKIINFSFFNFICMPSEPLKYRKMLLICWWFLNIFFKALSWSLFTAICSIDEREQDLFEFYLSSGHCAQAWKLN